MATDTRTSISSSYILSLNGKEAGALKSVVGGGATADVVSLRTGSTTFARKNISGVKYDPVELQAGLSLSQEFYDWIAAMWAGKDKHTNGALIEMDARSRPVQEQQFFNALIMETTIPALDAAASKEAGYLGIKFQPEYTRNAKSTGESMGRPNAEKKKTFLLSNFRLELSGLNCSGIRKIDSFTVRQELHSVEVGNGRDHQVEPGNIEFPNLKISLAENTAQTWLDWHEDFVIKGKCDDAHEKSGALIFLAPNMSELFRINLKQVGIFRLMRDKYEASIEKIRPFTAELYCEQMELVFSATKETPKTPIQQPMPA